MMTGEERALVEQLSDRLEALLRGERHRFEPPAGGSSELVRLAQLLAELVNSLDDAHEFISALSQGQLDIAPPSRNHLIAAFKQLHAHLRHLTWQTQQIAAGDLNQCVEFMGEFSVAFNAMIASLREKQVAEDKLRYVSNHDALTDLYNRTYFTEEMARIERGRRFPVSIIVADLDGLKKVNDTLGHDAGDRLIQAAARVLRQAVRGDDVLARIGGDEFAFILSATDQDGAARVVSRVREIEALDQPPDPRCRLCISLGVATKDKRGKLADLLKLADQRMYENKFARKECAPKGSR